MCETGIDEPEPEIHWKLDAERAHALRMAKCTAVKHVIQRTARECPDVVFLAIEVRVSARATVWFMLWAWMCRIGLWGPLNTVASGMGTREGPSAS